MRMYCPICLKKMRFNHFTKEYYCPIEKINQEKKEGCGYVWNPQSKFPPIVTEEDKKIVLKALGGKCPN